MTVFTSFLILSVCIGVEALKCHMCEGWHGSYPAKSTQLSTCDNLNNQCQTDFYCVKITDPMTPGVTYTTYKAQCWTQSQLQVTPTNVVSVANEQCYDYEDNSVPRKRYKYCFCNNKDYCNSVHGLTLVEMLLIPLFALLLF
ncbi:hypothetical protein Q1695_012949 [Nippostrongylus brasiliensis]|nr:hypothetical protein Q1695_012949 [Nippostrongylus brasiliensis]